MTKMAQANVGYELLRNSQPPSRNMACVNFTPDLMMPVSTMHRMALKAQEKIMLLMNNTELLTRHHRLSNMNEVLVYLTGNNEDMGMPGDRGDFYRRKLSEQLFVHYGIHNIDHNNVLEFVEGVIKLEHDSRFILSQLACHRSEAPPINVDGQVFDIIGRLADMQ